MQILDLLVTSTSATPPYTQHPLMSLGYENTSNPNPNLLTLTLTLTLTLIGGTEGATYANAKTIDSTCIDAAYGTTTNSTSTTSGARSVGCSVLSATVVLAAALLLQ